MKFKYYLRGAGMGVIFATILLTVAFSKYLKQLPKEEPTTATGNGQTIEQAMTKPPEKDREDQEDLTAPDDTGQEDGDAPDEGTADIDANRNPEGDIGQNEDHNSEGDTDDNKNQNEDGNADKNAGGDTNANGNDNEVQYIDFVIRGGQFSDVVSNNLAKAGLVPDGESYNKWLMRHGYDGKIQPGTYRIRMGATFKEIALIITERD